MFNWHRCYWESIKETVLKSQHKNTTYWHWLCGPIEGSNVYTFTYCRIIYHLTLILSFILQSLKRHYWRHAQEIVVWNQLLPARSFFAFFHLKIQNVREIAPTLLLWCFTQECKKCFNTCNFMYSITTMQLPFRIMELKNFSTEISL